MNYTVSDLLNYLENLTSQIKGSDEWLACDITICDDDGNEYNLVMKETIKP